MMVLGMVSWPDQTGSLNKRLFAGKMEKVSLEELETAWQRHLCDAAPRLGD